MSLNFIHGPVMAGKSGLLLLLMECIYKPILVVPSPVATNNDYMVASRIEARTAKRIDYFVDKNFNFLDKMFDPESTLIIDEAQFLENDHIRQLKELLSEKRVKNVICFGITRNHQNTMFEASKYLISEAICTMLAVKCNYCDEVAVTNIRGDGNYNMDIEDPRISFSDDHFYPVCDGCWKRQIRNCPNISEIIYEEITRKRELTE